MLPLRRCRACALVRSKRLEGQTEAMFGSWASAAAPSADLTCWPSVARSKVAVCLACETLCRNGAGICLLRRVYSMSTQGNLVTRSGRQDNVSSDSPAILRQPREKIRSIGSIACYGPLDGYSDVLELISDGPRGVRNCDCTGRSGGKRGRRRQ